MARIRKKTTSKMGNQNHIIWKIAIYIRLSKDDGNDESLSVTNQRKILTEYLNKFFKEKYEITDYYIDDGLSGTDYERPDFQRMIHDAETKRINCIICKNLARAFRNYSDQGYFLETFFPLHQIRFVTLGEPKVDTYLNPEVVNGMEVPINGLMNDRFAFATSSSVRRTFDTKRRNGEFIGAFAPYGYAKNPNNKNTLMVDEESARVVRDIFDWYVYGESDSSESMSKEGIARKLNEMGIPNPTLYKIKQGYRYKNPHAKQNDGLWQGSSISRILRNKVYIGTMVQGRQRVISYKVHDTINVPEKDWYQVENTHEPIVSVEIFKKAAEIYTKDTRAAPGKKKTYLFSGFLKCADCGKAMTRRSASGFVYYNCSTYKRKSKTKCTKHTIRLDILEKTVLLVIQKQIELISSIQTVIDRINEAPAANTQAARYETLLELRREDLMHISDLLSNIYIDWKNGYISEKQYIKMKEKFERQEEQLNITIRHIKKEIKALSRPILPTESSLEVFLKHKNISILTQGLLVELVKEILIHQNGEITVRFKFEDRYQYIAELAKSNKP